MHPNCSNKPLPEGLQEAGDPTHCPQRAPEKAGISSSTLNSSWSVSLWPTLDKEWGNKVPSDGGRKIPRFGAPYLGGRKPRLQVKRLGRRFQNKTITKNKSTNK